MYVRVNFIVDNQELCHMDVIAVPPIGAAFTLEDPVLGAAHYTVLGHRWIAGTGTSHSNAAARLSPARDPFFADLKAVELHLQRIN